MRETVGRAIGGIKSRSYSGQWPFCKVCQRRLKIRSVIWPIFVQDECLTLDAYKASWYWTLTNFNTSSGSCTASSTKSVNKFPVWSSKTGCDISWVIWASIVGFFWGLCKYSRNPRVFSTARFSSWSYLSSGLKPIAAVLHHLSPGSPGCSLCCLFCSLTESIGMVCIRSSIFTLTQLPSLHIA